MCYVSLEFPAFKLWQGSTMMTVQCFLSLKIPVKPNQYWGTTAVFNASIIMIKIMNRPISRLYYFHNTNQISSIAIFYLYYFRQKDPKSHQYVRVFFLRTVLEVPCLSKLKTSLSGDRGPAKKNQKKSFSICHWNFNSITGHDYAKVSLLKAYITAHETDIICLSVTYLDPSIQLDNDHLEIPGYNLVRSDHPSNNKRGGVCIR